jgi:hypothetical protein
VAGGSGYAPCDTGRVIDSPAMDGSRKRVLAIVAGILVARHLNTTRSCRVRDDRGSKTPSQQYTCASFEHISAGLRWAWKKLGWREVSRSSKDGEWVAELTQLHSKVAVYETEQKKKDELYNRTS